MPEPEQVQRVTLARLPAVLMVVFACLMIGLLALQLLDIERQRRVAAEQREDTRALLKATGPVARETRPLVRRTREDYDEVRAAGRRADRLARETRPLVQDARPLVAELSDQNAPDALAEAGELAARLTEGDRLVALVDRAAALLDEMERTGQLREVRRIPDLAQTLVEIQRETLRVQRTTLEIQRQALDVLRRSHDIQSETLERIRNIDRRTGGTLTEPTGR